MKKLPREWINEDGVSMNFQFLRYAQPLIQGEVVVPHDNGVPVFARLDKVRVEKILPAYGACVGVRLNLPASKSIRPVVRDRLFLSILSIDPTAAKLLVILSAAKNPIGPSPR